MPVPHGGGEPFRYRGHGRERDVSRSFRRNRSIRESNLASMGIYIFSWKALKEALVTLSEQSNCDFGKACHSVLS